MLLAFCSNFAPWRRFLSAVAVSGALALPAFAAGLPPPYVSRALNAVLIPVDGAVQDAFGLAGEETGVLVLAVAPGGVAEAAGIEPGDVIGMASGKPVSDPILLDEIVYYWISQGSYHFGFDGWQGGSARTYTTLITLESFSTVIDVATVSSWSSYSSESFSYSEYTEEYSSEISGSYAQSETLIEEAASSEEFAAEEMASEDGLAEDGMVEDEVDPDLDTDGDGASDMSDTDDDNDGSMDEADPDDDGDGTGDAEE